MCNLRSRLKYKVSLKLIRLIVRGIVAENHVVDLLIFVHVSKSTTEEYNFYSILLCT
jgi:hypothetical protein